MSQNQRIAAIDWMRGFVMILMIIDHVAMAYNGHHLALDSAASFTPDKALPEDEFITRWITHLCAPVFVFLAGTALAISVERKVAKGVAARIIDKDILLRGGFIAILDPTIISLFSGKLIFQVLYAIGMAMICMAFLRRLSTPILLTLAFGWIIGGEYITSLFWPPTIGDNQSIIAALLFSTYSEHGVLSIKYPLLPWLAMMILGWVFGRYLLLYREGKTNIGPVRVLLISGIMALIGFALIRYFNDYGNMFLLRYGNDWVQWLHVSKYPPSASYVLLELGIMAVILGGMIALERVIGVRPNGFLLVLGQTSMFFYLVHRLILEGTATYGGLRGFGTLETTYIGATIGLIMLYPLCLWYRGFKQRHPDWILTKYI